MKRGFFCFYIWRCRVIGAATISADVVAECCCGTVKIDKLLVWLVAADVGGGVVIFRFCILEVLA
jgi:hypothetical protein